jgi:hypothetical protein
MIGDDEKHLTMLFVKKEKGMVIILYHTQPDKLQLVLLDLVALGIDRGIGSNHLM